MNASIGLESLYNKSCILVIATATVAVLWADKSLKHVPANLAVCSLEQNELAENFEMNT